MMLEQIKNATDRSTIKACLSYGMVFTSIFIDAQIDLEGEDFKTLIHTNYYTKHSLHRMEYKKVNDALSSMHIK